jgi:hypothetical protein
MIDGDRTIEMRSAIHFLDNPHGLILQSPVPRHGYHYRSISRCIVRWGNSDQSGKNIEFFASFLPHAKSDNCELWTKDSPRCLLQTEKKSHLKAMYFEKVIDQTVRPPFVRSD